MLSTSSCSSCNNSNTNNMASSSRQTLSPPVASSSRQTLSPPVASSTLSASGGSTLYSRPGSISRAPSLSSTSSAPMARPATKNASGRHRSLMAHAAFSLNALSFFLAFLIVDTLTFPDRPRSAKASHSSGASSRRSSFSFLSSRPKFLQPRRSASEEGRYLAVPTRSTSTNRERSSSHRRSSSASSASRTSSVFAGASPNLSSWMSSLGICQVRRTSSEAEIKELAKLREEQERNSKGTLKHYQKKIFEMQVAKALSLQPFVKFFIVLLLVGLIATALLFTFTGAELRSWIAETLIADPARITLTNMRSCAAHLASRAGLLQQHPHRTDPTTVTSSTAHTLGSFHLGSFSSWNVGRLTARLLPRAYPPTPSGLAAPMGAAVDAVKPGTKVVVKAWTLMKDSLSF